MPQTIQRSFTSGEIAPALQSRADLTKYLTGLNLCSNFFIRPQGGVYSRPGLSFRGEQGDHTKKGWLIPFAFNTEQTYMLVFEDLKMRVIRNGDFVLKPEATITGVTQANPAVVTTAAAHTFVTGESVTITGVVGMTELNGNTYTITVLTPTTFQLDGIDSTAFGAYTSGGLAQSDGIYELTTSYTEAQLPMLGFTQSADVMTIVHPNHDPTELGRLDHDNWTLTAINYASTVPAPEINALTAAGGGAGANNKQYTYTVTMVDADGVESLATSIATITTPSLSSTAHVIIDIGKAISNITQANPAVVTTAANHGFTTGDSVRIEDVVGMTEVNGNDYTITVLTPTTFELDGIDSSAYTAYTSGGRTSESFAYLRVYKDPSADTNVFGWIGDTEKLEFRDYNFAPITSDAPPQDRQPFTGADNKPSAVTYHQQRQIFANTYNQPQAVYTSQTGIFNSLRTRNPVRDDDAVTFTIAARQVNEIRHLLALDSLMLLTSGGEWITTEGQDKVLTPSTIGVRPHSYNGASWVRPAVINDTAIYVQEKGSRIRDLAYEFSKDKYTGTDLSLMSEHLFEGYEIIQMAYADEPYGILWCVRNDGVLLGLTYLREHEVWGWHQHNTDGEIESVAVIDESGRDAVYVIVKRHINGVYKRYVERLEAREQLTVEDCFYVDSGKSYSSSVIANITGATQADPVVITSVAHPFSIGDVVRIADVVGMTEINGTDFSVANVTANTFELVGEDGTAYTAYASGGTITKLEKVFTGLEHLEGKDVAILADGYVVEDKVVTSGSVTLDRAADKVHIGLSYTPAVETLDVDVAAVAETLKARAVSVSKVFIEVEKSRGGWVGGRKDPESGETTTFQEIKPRFVADSYGVIPLRTFKQEVSIDPQWSKGGGVRIEQRDPLPMSILSIIPQVDVGGS